MSFYRAELLKVISRVKALEDLGLDTVTAAGLALLDDATVVAQLATLGIVAGTYTPTLTAVANVSASTAFLVPYLRVGSFVAVGVYCSIDPNLSAPTTTTMGISLPIASNFANVHECMGTATNGRVGGSGDQITADTTNDRANLTFGATSGVADLHQGSFFYRII